MIKKKPTNRWETNDAAVWNGLKYCLVMEKFWMDYSSHWNGWKRFWLDDATLVWSTYYVTAAVIWTAEYYFFQMGNSCLNRSLVFWNA